MAMNVPRLVSPTRAQCPFLVGEIAGFHLVPMYYSQEIDVSRNRILGTKSVCFVPAFDGHTPANRVNAILTCAHSHHTLRPMLRRLRSVRRIVDILSLCQWQPRQ